MKKLKVLLCMLSLVSLAVLTACDDDDDNGGGGGGNNTNNNTSLSGQTATVTVSATSGDAFNVPVGDTYTVAFGDTDYTFTHGADTFNGTYVYDRAAGSNTATLTFDPGDPAQVDSTLTFADATSGTVQSTGADNSTESGTFTLSGP